MKLTKMRQMHFKLRPVVRKPFRLSPRKRILRAFKMAFVHARRHIGLRHLHDAEQYHWFFRSLQGNEVRTNTGAEIKRQWQSLFATSWVDGMGSVLREHFDNFDTNWLELLLPNDMAIDVQPRSHTPSFRKCP